MNRELVGTRSASKSEKAPKSFFNRIGSPSFQVLRIAYLMAASTTGRVVSCRFCDFPIEVRGDRCVHMDVFKYHANSVFEIGVPFKISRHAQLEKELGYMYLYVVSEFVGVLSLGFCGFGQA